MKVALPPRFSAEFRKKLIDRLAERGFGQKPCPMCDNNEFQLVGEGYANILLQTEYFAHPGIQLGKSAPCAMLGCRKCGFVSLHSIGLLGLMEEVEVEDVAIFVDNSENLIGG